MQNFNQSHQEQSIIDDYMFQAQSRLIRLGFWRKVYGIISAQLAYSMFVGIILISWTDLNETLKSNLWVFYLNQIATCIFTIRRMSKRKKYPQNYYLLAALTFFQSISIGFIASFYSTVVIKALILTTIMVISLTFQTFQSKLDLIAMGEFLPTFYILVTFGALIQIYFYYETAVIILTKFGVLIFSSFIVFDTHIILHHLSPEEYTIGAIDLYMDITNLFLHILRILNFIQN